MRYGVPEELLTPAASWSAWRLRKDFNAVKHQVARVVARGLQGGLRVGAGEPGGRPG